MLKLVNKILHRVRKGNPTITDYGFIDVHFDYTTLKISYRGYLEKDYVDYIVSVYREFYKDRSVDSSLEFRTEVQAKSITTTVIINEDLPF